MDYRSDCPKREALKMADLRRLAPTCADLRRPRNFIFCHGPKLLRVLDTQQSFYQPRSQRNYFKFVLRSAQIGHFQCPDNYYKN